MKATEIFTPETLRRFADRPGALLAAWIGLHDSDLQPLTEGADRLTAARLADMIGVQPSIMSEIIRHGERRQRNTWEPLTDLTGIPGPQAEPRTTIRALIWSYDGHLVDDVHVTVLERSTGDWIESCAKAILRSLGGRSWSTLQLVHPPAEGETQWRAVDTLDQERVRQAIRDLPANWRESDENQEDPETT